MDIGSDNLLSLWDGAVATPPYPTYTLLRDENGDLIRDADMKFIPDWSENLKFRYRVMRTAEGNPAMQELQKKFCKSNILYFCNVFCWTYDPRRDVPNIPFVTFPFQDDVLTWSLWLLKNRETGLIEKSRDMGLTWLMEVVSAYMVLFFPGMVDYQMSLREDDVDNRSEDSLLGKFRFLLRNLPDWMRAGWEENANGIDNKMLIRVPRNGATVRGQLTMGTSGRSGRASRVFNDEFAFVEDADRVLKALAALSPSGMYGSTPNGMGNAFYMMAHSENVRKKTLHWSMHPLKNPEWAAKERAKITYTDETWAQEHEVSYEMSTIGRVYPEFRSFVDDPVAKWCHIQDGEFYDYDPAYDVYLWLDFGMADPTSAVWVQIKGPPRHFEDQCSETIIAFDEEEHANKTVDEWAEIILERDYRLREVVGDMRTGGARDSKGGTWIKYLGQHGIHVVGRRQSAMGPINLVKSILRNPHPQATGKAPFIAVNRRRCPHLVKAFQNWSYPTDNIDGINRIKPKTEPKHDSWSHAMKAFAYGIDWRYGVAVHQSRQLETWGFDVLNGGANL